MVELPTPRLIVILSLLGLASFSLACTLTSRWSHLSNYRACIAWNSEHDPNNHNHYHQFTELGCLPFGTLPASLLASPINTFQGEQRQWPSPLLHDHQFTASVLSLACLPPISVVHSTSSTQRLPQGDLHQQHPHLNLQKLDNQSKIACADIVIRVLESVFTVSTFLLLSLALWLLWATKDPHEVEAFDYSAQECRTPWLLMGPTTRKSFIVHEQATIWRFIPTY